MAQQKPVGSRKSASQQLRSQQPPSTGEAAQDAEIAGRADAAGASEAPEDAGRTSRQADDFPIVGLGASAGGIEALQQFFEALPADSGMAFLVVLHLAPEHSSMLADVLARHTAIAVQEARHGVPVQPDHVYVIPPGAYLTIRGRQLQLRESDQADVPRVPSTHCSARWRTSWTSGRSA